jgi:hypothetical protein
VSRRAAEGANSDVTQNRAWRKRGADKHNIVWVCVIVNIICCGDDAQEVTECRSPAALFRGQAAQLQVALMHEFGMQPCVVGVGEFLRHG